MTQQPPSLSVQTELLQLHLKKKKMGWVLFFSVINMLLEIPVGYVTNSMALLSDGWHIALHVMVMGLGWLTYHYLVYRHKKEQPLHTKKTLSFVGLINAAVIALAGLILLVECIRKLGDPTAIKFEAGIAMAAVGLVLNIISLRILHPTKAHTDHTIRATHLHLAADILTSVLAFLALVVGFYLQWPQADPLAGMISAVIILFWAKGIITPAWKEFFSEHQKK